MADFRRETERLVLRDWNGDRDWQEFFRHTNTPEVMRWLGGVMQAEAVAAQRSRVETCSERNGHCFWLVERKDDGEVLGFCGLKRSDAPDSPTLGEFEVGWRLREDAWGQGYAKEAALASLAAGFESFGAQEIVALTIIENAPSWGLMKRIGMRRREDLDFTDLRPQAPFRDTIVYSIDRCEWEARQ
ncbi:GCN5 family acetyltransferase [Erythrobacter sp. SG61-1L]|uniref:GNAT family N-acetyltransferase n=1 Tax=Erythrobacter sp. SG61-1L TaxID=1603897 RepID=UPI0006C90331|nr:GNAT family N-acetyltransferase [Erythrobacter sp. SG61-1L]KPL69055.1 GCN5 family acetyltransferase [Erythrobacter sp. SG61-1L]